MAAAVAVGYAVRDARPRHTQPRHVICVSHSRTRTTSPRVVRVINVPLSPARDRHARAAAGESITNKSNFCVDKCFEISHHLTSHFLVYTSHFFSPQI